MVAVLCSALLLTPVYSETAVQAATAKSTTASSEIPQNGWYKLKNGQKKYFKDGKYLVGRQKNCSQDHQEQNVQKPKT